jgi:penicillin-binding protein 1A
MPNAQPPPRSPGTDSPPSIERTKVGKKKRSTLKLASQKPRKPLWWRITKWTLIVGGSLFLLGVIGVASVFYYYGSDASLPKIQTLDDYHPKVTTRIMSADGQLIGEVFTERRTVVPYEQIPPVLIQAVLCAEDADFFEHGPLNYWGIARALFKDVTSGQARQGGSTITQQVVKTMLLSREKTVRRKVQEIVLAYRLEKELTKEQILDLYLNQIDFGGSRYGVEEAARYYFAKDVKDVNLAEATILASLPQSPERYCPRSKDADLAGLKARQKYVLDQMVDHGYISQAQDDAVASAPIPLAPENQIAPYEGSAPEVVDEVTRELQQQYGPDELATLGATVITTVDTRMEAQARTSLESGLRQLDQREGFSKASAHLTGKALTKEIAGLKAGLAAAKPPGVHLGPVYEAVVTAVDDASGTMVLDLGGVQGVVSMADNTRYAPATGKPTSSVFKAGDVLHVSLIGPAVANAKLGIGAGALAVRLELGPQGAMVVLDPKTREVKALVGGYGFAAGGFDRALSALRQPGSSFKPVIYATAFASRKFTPASMLDDSPEVYADLDKVWRPQNAEKEDFLGPVRLRVALAKSINTVAIKLLSELGPQNQPVLDQARALGLETLFSDKEMEGAQQLSLGLGASDVKPIELINAYASFDDGGIYLPPTYIQSINDEPPEAPAPSQALDPAVAYLMTNVLEQTLIDGTAGGYRERLGRPAAGKTGTTSGNSDCWFIGYTPDLVAGVWVGFDDMRSLGSAEYGATAAAPIWLDFMKATSKGQPLTDFQQPGGITDALIDPSTGLLANHDDPQAIDEVFLDGTAPTETAPPDDLPGQDDFVIDQLGGQ